VSRAIGGGWEFMLLLFHFGRFGEFTLSEAEVLSVRIE
jgi:hypothetical protein